MTSIITFQFVFGLSDGNELVPGLFQFPFYPANLGLRVDLLGYTSDHSSVDYQVSERTKLLVLNQLGRKSQDQPFFFDLLGLLRRPNQIIRGPNDRITSRVQSSGSFGVAFRFDLASDQQMGCGTSNLFGCCY